MIYDSILKMPLYINLVTQEGRSIRINHILSKEILQQTSILEHP